MSQFNNTPQGHAPDQQHANDFLSGRIVSPAPYPQSVRLPRPNTDRDLIPLVPPQLGSGHAMPTPLDGQGDTQQLAQTQPQQTRAPSVIVIEDSGDEEEEIKQAILAEQASSAPQAREDDGALHALQYQQFYEVQGQTRALLELPAVNIPRNERFKTPRALLCKLLPHQRVGMTWLIRQEEDPNKKGSILADGMGLGKTIEALALILSRKFDPRHPTCKTTLVVAPLGLLQQWSDEIRNKVTLRFGNKLSTLVLHGLGVRRVKAQQLLEYDIVLCTYGKLVAEYNMYMKGLRSKCKLLAQQTKFYRVILDEAHYIKNKNSQSSKAVCLLQAVHRLCMTGTPLMNNVTELYSLIRFLRIQPYNDWQKFSEDMDRPILRWEVGMDSPAMLRLQALVRSLVLRRHKDSYLDGRRILELKKRTDIEIYVEFGDEQRAFYEALAHRQKLKFNKYLKEGTVMKNYMIILTWVLRMRQACDHPYLVQNHCIPDVCDLDAEGMINLALQLPVQVRNTISAMDEFRCPKCEFPAESITKNPVIISPCGHYICAGCYAKLMEENILLNGEGDDAPDKFDCPNEGCTSIIRPDNILMHNFFVDAHMDQGDVWDDEPLDDDIELIELDSDSDDEGIEYNPYSQQPGYPIPSIEQREETPGSLVNPNLDEPGSSSAPGLFGDSYPDGRESTLGLFVDPYPNEPDVFGNDDPPRDEDTVSGDEQLFVTTQEPNALRDSTAPRDFRPTLGSAPRPISRPASEGNSIFRRSVATLAPPKGHYEDPVDVDDEADEASFNAVSRILAAEADRGRGRRIKHESQDQSVEDETESGHRQPSDIPNFDGPNSAAPESKRKGSAGERSASEVKRLRLASLSSMSSGTNNHRPSYHMYVESETGSPAPFDRMDTAGPADGRQPRARYPSLAASHGDIVGPAHGEQRARLVFPKIEEDDIKPDMSHSGYRARDVLQRPFVSLSDKRHLADKSQRAMAAYQKRVASEWVPSAKTEKVIELLQTIRREHPGDKTLIFSFWTVFLDMLEPPLREAKFKYTVYSGAMKTDNRTAAVRTFMSHPELDVMLISISAGSCGLNLTAANHVILAEPFWNPFSEEQAIDRAHRLGQTKEVTVYRLLVKDTIEDYITNLQRKKKELVSEALCDATADSPLNRLSIGDLRALFGV